MWNKIKLKLLAISRLRKKVNISDNVPPQDQIPDDFFSLSSIASKPPSLKVPQGNGIYCPC